MQVADTTSIDAEINVDETDIARVKVGAEARIVPAAFPDKTLIGRVDQVAISPRQQAGQNKSYPVRIKLNSDTGVTFHPGMSCRAEVLTGAGTQTPVLAVPVQALRYEDSAAITSGSSPGSKAATDKSTTSVFVLKDGKVVKKVVQTGVADDAYIAVTKGLEAGEKVVTGPSKVLLFLKDGDKAAINTTPAAKPSENSASVTIE
jgi:HlyD family secretion protein